MQKAYANKFFRTVCRAFPKGNVLMLQKNGEVMAKRFLEEMNGKESFGIDVSISDEIRLELNLKKTDYKDKAEAERMLKSLQEFLRAQSAQKNRRKRDEVEENRLLISLLYVDTMEMQIYTELLAEEKGKDLSLPRAVCVIRGRNGQMAEIMYQILHFSETDPEDIFGVIGGENVILCRRLKEEKKSVRFQCADYLEKLSERIERKCGFYPEIWVGTKATQTGEYRLSMEAAVEAGACAQLRKKYNAIVYASEYLLERTMIHTNFDVLSHFIGGYANILEKENDLLDTAEALIDNNMNISLAAKERFVHRNTMMRHAAKMCKELDIDPFHSDRDRFLLMMVCFYCRKYLENR